MPPDLAVCTPHIPLQHKDSVLQAIELYPSQHPNCLHRSKQTTDKTTTHIGHTYACEQRHDMDCQRMPIQERDDMSLSTRSRCHIPITTAQSPTYRPTHSESQCVFHYRQRCHRLMAQTAVAAVPWTVCCRCVNSGLDGRETRHAAENPEEIAQCHWQVYATLVAHGLPHKKVGR